MSKPPIPPKVAAAINAVMVEVKRLDKGAENKHGNYKFTSVDDFLDANIRNIEGRFLQQAIGDTPRAPARRAGVAEQADDG